MGRDNEKSAVENIFGGFENWYRFVWIYNHLGSVFAADIEKHFQYIIVVIKPTCFRAFDQDDGVPRLMWEHQRLSWYHGEYVCWEESSLSTARAHWLVQNPRPHHTHDKSPSRYTQIFQNVDCKRHHFRVHMDLDFWVPQQELYVWGKPGNWFNNCMIKSTTPTQRNSKNLKIHIEDSLQCVSNIGCSIPLHKSNLCMFFMQVLLLSQNKMRHVAR